MIDWHYWRCGCDDEGGFWCLRWQADDPDWCDTHGWEMLDCRALIPIPTLS